MKKVNNDTTINCKQRKIYMYIKRLGNTISGLFPSLLSFI